MAFCLFNISVDTSDVDAYSFGIIDDSVSSADVEAIEACTIDDGYGLEDTACEDLQPEQDGEDAQSSSVKGGCQPHFFPVYIDFSLTFYHFSKARLYLNRELFRPGCKPEVLLPPPQPAGVFC